MIRGLGLAHLLLETDGPYVALPGEPAFHCGDIAAVGVQVARLLDLPEREVAETTRTQAQSLFCASFDKE